MTVPAGRQEGKEEFQLRRYRKMRKIRRRVRRERRKQAEVCTGRRRLKILTGIFCMSASVLIGRLFSLQIQDGADYLAEAGQKVLKTQEIKATRGNIYDRNGVLLAYNEPSYVITFDDPTSSDQSTEERNETINRILEQVLEIVNENGDSVVDSFGITLDAEGNYQYTQSSETARLRFLADIYGYSSVDDLSEKQANQTAEELMEYLCTDEINGYGLDVQNSDRQYLLDMVNMRYAIRLNRYQQYQTAILAEDVSEETVAGMKEHVDELPGIEIGEDSVRRYTDPEVFSSILGYTGQISESEYEALDNEEKEQRSLTDIVGKDGIEEAFDNVLRGTDGETTLYVDTLGKVIETVSTMEPTAGNDLYLTIDSELQKNIYCLIEEKLAGILLSKLQNVLTYDASWAADSSDIIIPVGDAYYSLIGNYVIDYTEFGDEDAGDAEREVYKIFSKEKETVLSEIMEQLQDSDAPAYQELSEEMQEYMDYLYRVVTDDTVGMIDSDAVDTEDETCLAWKEEGSISLYTYLHEAISKNWIHEEKLTENGYSSSEDIYQEMLEDIENYIRADSSLDKLIYEKLIQSGTITGNQLCAIVYEQSVLEMDEDLYGSLRDGSLSAYSWLRKRIESLEITPGQLALEPCSAGVVVTDTDTGDVLACVSYPGYDSNRLANTMDTEYYKQLASGMNNIFYNRATQEKTAPGSTFKVVSAVAALTEGVINGNSTVSCSGEFTKVTPSSKCWIYPGAHGALNVAGALQNSCNSFFYEMGYRLGTEEDGTYNSDLGTDTLAEYAQMFGLGETSGLEIAEAEPEISDEYAIQSAIGQGTNNYTVSQLNRYVTAVANRGTVYSLTLADRATDSAGNVVEDYQAEVVGTMDAVSESTWDLVQEGMERMVEHSSTFSGLDFSMAGKTGTAQQSALHPDHALFVGYAPADEPEISVAVRITYGYSSSYAAEIGRDIARIYFEEGAADEIIMGTASVLGNVVSGD